jgi:ribosomal protein S6
MEVVSDGGVVRSIQNHGIRDLPHRIKAKRPDIFGNRYFDKGRFVSIYYDGNPNTIRMIENVLVFNDDVIRRATLKARNPLWYVNIAREDKNPYVGKVRRMEHEARMQQQQLAKQQRLAERNNAAATASDTASSMSSSSVSADGLMQEQPQQQQHEGGEGEQVTLAAASVAAEVAGGEAVKDFVTETMEDVPMEEAASETTTTATTITDQLMPDASEPNQSNKPE